jgi:hypothetical protein
VPLSLPLANSAEGGTDEANVTSGNSGGASGNAFPSVFFGANATAKFENALSANGTTCYKFATGATATQSLVEWEDVTPATRSYGRFYIRFTGYANAPTFVIVYKMPGPAFSFRLSVSAAGLLQLRDSGGTVVATGSATIAVDTWYRVEWDITTGSGQPGAAWLFLGNSTTPLDSLSVSSENFGTAGPTNFAFGYYQPSAANLPLLYLDDLAIGSTALFGPSALTPMRANNADGGTDQATVTTANSGGSSGHAWDSVTIGADATCKYEHATYAGQAASYSFATGATSATTFVTWSSSVVAHVRSYGRAYFRFTSLSTTPSIVRARGSGTQAFRVTVTSAGLLQLRNTGNTVIATGSVALSTLTWYRLEWDVSRGASASGTLWVYLGHSTTPVDSVTVATGDFGTADFTEYNFGIIAATSNQAAQWIDEIAVGRTGLFGPIASNDKSGTVALAGSGVLAVSGVAGRFGAVAAAGSGALAVSGVAGRRGQVALAGSSVLTVSGLAARQGAVALTGSGSFTVTGEQPVGPIIYRPDLGVIVRPDLGVILRP